MSRKGRISHPVRHNRAIHPHRGPHATEIPHPSSSRIQAAQATATPAPPPTPGRLLHPTHEQIAPTPPTASPGRLLHPTREQLAPRRPRGARPHTLRRMPRAPRGRFDTPTKHYPLDRTATAQPPRHRTPRIRHRCRYLAPKPRMPSERRWPRHHSPRPTTAQPTPQPLTRPCRGAPRGRYRTPRDTTARSAPPDAVIARKGPTREPRAPVQGVPRAGPRLARRHARQNLAKFARSMSDRARRVVLLAAWQIRCMRSSSPGWRLHCSSRR